MSRVKGLNDINFVNFYSSGAVNVGSVSALTKGCVIFIQANTFKDNDVFKVVSTSYNSSGTVAWGTDFYWNTANTLTGAVQISTGNGVLGTDYIQHSRTFKIVSKTGTGDGTVGLNTDIGNPDEYILGNNLVTPVIINALGKYSIDWTKDSYIMVGLSATSNQSMRNSFMKIYTF